MNIEFLTFEQKAQIYKALEGSPEIQAKILNEFDRLEGIIKDYHVALEVAQRRKDKVSKPDF